MEEIREGIYRYDGELESSSDRSLVLVHPWYNEEDNNFKVFGEGIVKRLFSRGYESNLNDLLVESLSRNVFLFEEDKIKDESCERIIDIRGRRGFYIIPTCSSSPDPIRSSWKDTMEFIRGFGNNVDVAGGFVCGNRFGHYGCAGDVYRILKREDFDVKFVKGCCFT